MAQAVKAIVKQYVQEIVLKLVVLAQELVKIIVLDVKINVQELALVFVKANVILLVVEAVE